MLLGPLKEYKNYKGVQAFLQTTALTLFLSALESDLKRKVYIPPQTHFPQSRFLCTMWCHHKPSYQCAAGCLPHMNLAGNR